MSKLSVVLPTLNCMNMLPRHVQTMRAWLDHVDEVVVVDSHSTDGTVEYLQKNLNHPNVRFFTRPRGLYQSWNFAIEQTVGQWVYVSTVGDAIAPPLLTHLREVGEDLKCDVVASRPNFIDENDQPVNTSPWPIDHILKATGRRKPVRIVGPELFFYGLIAIPCGLLGSSASNLYRGDHIRARPFPTEFGTVGDTAWSLRYGLETAYAFTPSSGSIFRIHEKAYSKAEYDVDGLCRKLADLAVETLADPALAAPLKARIAALKLVETAKLLAARLRRSAALAT